MDPIKLKEMDVYLEKNCPLIRSVMVIRNGYIVFEKYYLGDANVDKDIFSVTKSITSALAGIAIDKGYINNIDQKAVSFFPELVSKISDSRFEKVTIRHLLTMSTGYQTSYGGPQGADLCLGKSLLTEPGASAAYSGCSSHLVSCIISKATKMSTLEFGYKYLFEPLGIKKPFWSENYDGCHKGSYGLYMAARDMAKIGYLYLQNGVWDGNQIISDEWINDSTQKQILLNFGQKVYKYGYFWWITSAEGQPDFSSAVGYGGQYIHVVPDLDLVIVATSDERVLKPKHFGFSRTFIIPAVKK